MQKQWQNNGANRYKMTLTLKTKLNYKDKKHNIRVKEIKIIAVYKKLNSATIYILWTNNTYTLRLYNLDYINKIFKQI